MEGNAGLFINQKYRRYGGKMPTEPEAGDVLVKLVREQTMK